MEKTLKNDYKGFDDLMKQFADASTSTAGFRTAPYLGVTMSLYCSFSNLAPEDGMTTLLML